MIKIITDNGSYLTHSLDDLKALADKIFADDPSSEVMLTYVVTTQPTSRRIGPHYAT